MEEVGKKHSLETVYYQPLKDFRFEGGVGVRGHVFIMKKQQKEEEL